MVLISGHGPWHCCHVLLVVVTVNIELHFNKQLGVYS